MLSALQLNKLQRKVLLIILLIMLLPMLVTGILSARWVATRIDESIEHWVRESEQLDQSALSDLHRNARLLVDTISQVNNNQWKIQPGRSPIPANLQPLATELGISLVQVYGVNSELIYSSRPATLATSWAPGQDTAVVKVNLEQQNLLAAITIIRIPAADNQHYRLVLGTLFDKEFLNRMSRLSGLKIRLFYPSDGDFAKAFSEEGRPLKLRLPPFAFNRLLNKQSWYSAQAEDGHYFGLYSPVMDASGQVEAVWFSGRERTRSIELVADETALTLVIIFFGSLLALGVGLMLARLVVRPVKYLHDGVIQLAAQDFRASIPINSDDELGELAKAFNGMAQSLRDARNQQQREFQSDKLTALGELSMAMAHEIRNPISIINTASKLLDSSTDDSRRPELCRVIHEESQRLNQLLGDFQQLARHRRPEFKLIDPVEPLEKAIWVTLAGRDQIKVERNFTHAKQMINADPEILRQAWLNLINNALEAMGSKGGTLKVGSRLRDNKIEIYLQDSGPGISIDQITRLFEPFYTSKEHGSGLGLTIVNTLVEAIGGSVEFVPGNWQGARFAMLIPIGPETAQEETENNNAT
jgi:signal transduction histidine kinase